LVLTKTYRNQITPDRSGLGSPIGKDDISARRAAEREEEQREAEEAGRAKPSVPYRADTTGLTTSHLPPPPGRKDGADGRNIIVPPPISTTSKKPPGLPPRLPPRQNSTPVSPPPRYTSTEPESDRGIMNQGALNRLGAAGVVVPGFGIEGRKAPMPPPSSNSPTRSDGQKHSSPQLNELQSRFSRLTPSSPKSDSPSEGTTFAQKQAALRTASSFRNDPSSVSFSDAKMAAGTANNFKERHGDQVKSGWQSANKINTKYGISEKVATYGDSASQQATDTSSPAVAVLVKKKPPPPPPMKKPSLSGGGSLPPPIPLSTKPKAGAYS